MTHRRRVGAPAGRVGAVGIVSAGIVSPGIVSVGIVSAGIVSAGIVSVGIVAICLVALVGGCTSSSASVGGVTAAAQPSELRNQPVSKYAGFGLVPLLPRPSFELRDVHGAAYSFGTRTAGRPTLLFFGYTHCPDDCPTTMADIHAALTALPAALRARTLVVFVTTDPKRDNGAVIAKWLRQFSSGLPAANVVGLTGTQTQIDAAQAAAHVMIAQDHGQTHSTAVLLYGPDDYAHVSFTLGTNERSAIEHDLPLVAADPAAGS